MWSHNTYHSGDLSRTADLCLCNASVTCSGAIDKAAASKCSGTQRLLQHSAYITVLLCNSHKTILTHLHDQAGVIAIGGEDGGQQRHGARVQ